MCRKEEKGIAFCEIGASREPGGQVAKDFSSSNRQVHLLVIDGQLDICINGQTRRLHRGNFVDGIHQSISLRRTSPDARAYVLVLTENYLADTLKDRMPFSPAYLMHNLADPVHAVAQDGFRTILRGMERIRQSIFGMSSRFADDILQQKLLIYLLELAEILETDNVLPSSLEMGKKRELFIAFMQTIPLHIKKEHTVNFYAGCLHVTPQYLRRIVKEFSGQSAYYVISHYLNREICKLLSDTRLSLQEIADELHFSDQAVLSKFFKRINGTSPLKYRNERK